MAEPALKKTDDDLERKRQFKRSKMNDRSKGAISKDDWQEKIFEKQKNDWNRMPAGLKKAMTPMGWGQERTSDKSPAQNFGPLNEEEKTRQFVNASPEARQLMREKGMAPEEEKAEQAKQGAEMEGEEENEFDKALKNRDERKKSNTANLNGADASKLKGVSPVDKKLASDLANITGREAPLTNEQKKQQFANASPQVQQLMREKGMAPKTEKEIAEEKRQGAPMEGVSESAGLTGGIGGQEKEGQKAPASAQPPAEPAQAPTQPPAPSGEAGEGPEEPEEEPQKPQSTFQQTQQKIDEQKKRVSGSQDKAAKAKEKYEKDLEQKSWKRALSGRKMKKREKEAAKEKKKQAKLEKLLETQMATGGALKFSWLNLIDTFGATYLYIAFHFLNTYFTPWSNFFCKFGEEWLPKSAQKTGGEAAKQASKGLELVESCACVLIGLLLFFAIMGLLVLFATLGYAYTHKLETLYQLGPGIAWEAIKIVGGWIFGVN